MSDVPLELDVSLPFPTEFVIRDTPRSHQSPNTKGKEFWKRKVGAIADAQVKTLRDVFYIDHINPPPEIVPKFLGNFRPDAMAVGPEGGIIIEVKLRSNPASEKHRAAIAKRVSDQTGWEFRIIYLNPPPDETLSIAKPIPEQLQATFKEIEALAKAGHPAAALVRGWAALESLARLASANSEARTSRGFSPIQAIQTLAEEGYLENEAAERLRAMVKLRNAVVHGDFSVDVPTEQVQDLLRQLQAIASDIMSVTPDKTQHSSAWSPMIFAVA